MEFTGRVVSGLGEGGKYVKRYNRHFLEKLGFEAFPGTLNLRVGKRPVFKNAITITPEEKGLFPVGCRAVILNNKVRGAVVVPVKTAHGEDILEIISPLNVKEYLSLKDGDEVIVRVV